MADAFAIVAAVLLVAGGVGLFYAAVRAIWRREQEYKARRLAERSAAGLPAPTKAERVRESVAAVLAASVILAAMIYFGQGGHPSRALFIALPIVYAWRWFRGRRGGTFRAHRAESSRSAQQACR